MRQGRDYKKDFYRGVLQKYFDFLKPYTGEQRKAFKDGKISFKA